MDNAIFKFNSGMGALLCSSCSAIIKVGRDFTIEEWEAMKGNLTMGPRYCKKCLPSNRQLSEEDMNKLIKR